MSKSIIAMLVMLVLLFGALGVMIMQMTRWDPQLQQATERRRQQGQAETADALQPSGDPQYVSNLENADQLKQVFNADNGNVRILAILSPTTTSSLQAAQYLQQEILEAKPQLEVAVYVVWIQQRSGDTYDAAYEATALLSDPRASHYYGSDAAAAYVADALGYPGEKAWNLIMQFEDNALWEPEMPRPARYYHQLGPDHWLGAPFYVTGNDLRNALAAMAADLEGWSF